MSERCKAPALGQRLGVESVDRDTVCLCGLQLQIYSLIALASCKPITFYQFLIGPFVRDPLDLIIALTTHKSIN